jgi:hypothetical protein
VARIVLAWDALGDAPAEAIFDTYDDPVRFGRRFGLVILGAFTFGLLAAWAKGPNGGIDTFSTFRTDLGNLSAPWLLVAFLAGTQASRLMWGALLGLAATLSALFGFYLLSSMIVDLGSHSLLGDLWRELSANRIYLEAGLASGPIFGALGAWWTRTRTLGASIVVGALMIAEPLATLALGMISSNGALRSPELPAVVRGVSGWGLTPGGSGDAVSYAVYATELVVGLCVLLLAALSARQRRSKTW